MPTEVISFRIDSSIAAKLDQWRGDLSRSEFCKQQITKAIERKETGWTLSPPPVDRVPAVDTFDEGL